MDRDEESSMPPAQSTHTVLLWTVPRLSILFLLLLPVMLIMLMVLLMLFHLHVGVD